MANRHITWVDDAKTLTMLLVIIGHCTYYNIMTPYGGIHYFDGVGATEYSLTWRLLGVIVRFVYTFHMPLFMMLSGACFSLSVKKTSNIGILAKTKARRLLVPFLCTTILLAVPLKYISGYYVDSTDVLRDILLGQLLVMGNTHLWFVCSLFWIFIMYYALYRVGITSKRWFIPTLIPLSLGAAYAGSKGVEFVGMVAALKHILYFSIGFKALSWGDSLKWGGQKLLFHSVCFLCIFIMHRLLIDIDLIVVRMLRPFLPIVMGIYGSLIMIQMSKKVGTLQSLTSSKIYKSFSRNSYELYLFSDPFNYVLTSLLYAWLGQSLIGDWGSITSFLVRFFGTIILSYLVILIKNWMQTMISNHGPISKS